MFVVFVFLFGDVVFGYVCETDITFIQAFCNNQYILERRKLNADHIPFCVNIMGKCCLLK